MPGPAKKPETDALQAALRKPREIRRNKDLV